MDKRHILNEIKRTAAANDGMPLGWRRFFQETGIKEGDWKGRFWARWSDAVREAGLDPNKKQSATSADLLIERYITVIRELGRLPVESELQLKRRDDPNFPSSTTFRKFGGKQQFVTMVRDYCTGREGYDDIVPLCISDAADSPSETDADTSEDAFGFVYLFKSGRHYKIGHSNSVGRREYELAIQLPEKLTLVHSIRTDDPAGIEAYWHRRFAEKRGNGEWFKLSGDDVRVFKRRRFM